MSTMEERVKKLEDAVFGSGDRRKDWRATVGKFDNDAFMGDVIDGALKSREEERQKAQDESERETQ